MIVRLIGRLRRDRKGQGLVEYGLIIAGVALVTAAAISIFGHKTNDMVAATAAVLPGAHPEDNGPIASGQLIETTKAAGGGIQLDTSTTALQNGLGAGIGLNAETLVVDPVAPTP